MNYILSQEVFDDENMNFGLLSYMKSEKKFSHLSMEFCKRVNIQTSQNIMGNFTRCILVVAYKKALGSALNYQRIQRDRNPRHHQKIKHQNLDAGKKYSKF